MKEVIVGTDTSLAQTKKVRVSFEQWQPWDSSPKYALLGVNNGVDTTGIKSLLAHHQKVIEKCYAKLATLKLK